MPWGKLEKLFEKQSRNKNLLQAFANSTPSSQCAWKLALEILEMFSKQYQIRSVCTFTMCTCQGSSIARKRGVCVKSSGGSQFVSRPWFSWVSCQAWADQPLFLAAESERPSHPSVIQLSARLLGGLSAGLLLFHYQPGVLLHPHLPPPTHKQLTINPYLEQYHICLRDQYRFDFTQLYLVWIIYGGLLDIAYTKGYILHRWIQIFQDSPSVGWSSDWNGIAVEMTSVSTSSSSSESESRSFPGCQLFVDGILSIRYFIAAG